MWGVTAYFNPIPERGKIRLENFQRFRQTTKKQGLKLCVVELLYDQTSPELTEDMADILIYVKTSTERGVLWQKERLLNIALENLPKDCNKVCWIDADLIFQNNDWVSQTEALLEKFPIIQPFSVVCMLPRDWRADDTEELHEVLSGAPHRFRASCAYAATMTETTSEKDYSIASQFSSIFNRLGTVDGVGGLCWAAKRELLNKCNGFFDYNVIGGGDSIMVRSLFRMAQLLTGFSDKHKKKIEEYLNLDSFKDIKVGCLDGLVLHMWHGKVKNRKYSQRHEILLQYQFDPQKHIQLNSDKVWEWTNNAPKELIEKVRKYFVQRHEM